MVSRKRAREEMEADEPPHEPSTQDKLRSMWEFANLMQYINIFGDAVKIDPDLDIQDLEAECLAPQPSEKLARIGLAMLKHVSSHKGLTPEIFDEYTRRQYVAKAPQRNPFGTEEIPNKFDEFDIFTKVRVLQQLSVWTFHNPNWIRERMNASDTDQALWRMEPLGWDSEDRALFVLDDNRLYRRTDPPLPALPVKAKSKPKPKKSRGTRSSKRRKASSPEPEPEVLVDDEGPSTKENDESQIDTFGGMKWECLCITLEEYQHYLASIRKSRDPNEKILFNRIEEDVLPAIERQAEEQAKKEARKLKDLEIAQKLALAKRSSRISARVEKQKEVEEAAEVERKRQAELAVAKAEDAKRKKLEEQRESRMMTREQRIKEREQKRILHEEELRRLKENSEKLDSNDGRISERHLKAEMRRRQDELQKLNEEEDWVFDCSVCGLHGENLDDGSHSVQCEKCNVWQHSKCHNITESQADRDDFHFICKQCKQRAQEPKLPPLKFRLTSESPKTQNKSQKPPTSTAPNGTPAATVGVPSRDLASVSMPVQQPTQKSPVQPPQRQSLMNGPSLSPSGQNIGPPGIQRAEGVHGSPMNHINGNSSPAPVRPYPSGQNNGVPIPNPFPISSPPQSHTPRAQVPQNYPSLYPSQNGSPFAANGPFMRPTPDPFNSSFSRPTSSASQGVSYHSPVKHNPVNTPQHSNGIPNGYSFNSPHSSFPPSSTQRPSFSPMKQQSPTPTPTLPKSSPAPIPPVAPSPSQILPRPIPAPEKHDGARPVSSHSMSETPVLPPIKSLSPSSKPPVLAPPMKKPSPTPERLQSWNGAPPPSQ